MDPPQLSGRPAAVTVPEQQLDAVVPGPLMTDKTSVSGSRQQKPAPSATPGTPTARTMGNRRPSQSAFGPQEQFRREPAAGAAEGSKNMQIYQFTTLERQESTAIKRWLVRYFLRPTQALPGTKTRKMIHPRSTFYVIWSSVQCIFLLFIAISVPLRLAFDPKDACELPIGWTYWDLIVDTVFVADLLLNFFVCREIDSLLVDVWSEVAGHYIKHDLLADLIKTIPVSYIQLPLQISGSCEGNLTILQLLKILKGLRIIRLVRLANLKRFIGAVTLHHQFLRNPNSRNLVKLMCFLVFALHCVACLWWYVKRNDDQLADWEVEQRLRDVITNPDGTLDYGEEPSDQSRYLVSFYFATSTLTTVGYGDISGGTDNERIAAIFSMVIGGMLFATIISHISALSMSLMAAHNAHEQRKDEVIQFMQYRKVPIQLQKQVTGYLDRFQTNDLEGSEVLDELPNSLQSQLLTVLAQNTLCKVHLFRNLMPNVLVAIYVHLKPLRCIPGEILTHQGENCNEIYFLVQGSLVLCKDSVPVDELEEGDVVGANSVLSQEARTTTVVAKDFSELYVLEREALDDVLSRFPGMAGVLRRRAEVLRRFKMQMTRPNNNKAHLPTAAQASGAEESTEHLSKLAIAARRALDAEHEKSPDVNNLSGVEDVTETQSSEDDDGVGDTPLPGQVNQPNGDVEGAKAAKLSLPEAPPKPNDRPQGGAIPDLSPRNVDSAIQMKKLEAALLEADKVNVENVGEQTYCLDFNHAQNQYQNDEETDWSTNLPPAPSVAPSLGDAVTAAAVEVSGNASAAAAGVRTDASLPKHSPFSHRPIPPGGAGHHAHLGMSPAGLAMSQLGTVNGGVPSPHSSHRTGNSSTPRRRRNRTATWSKWTSPDMSGSHINAPADQSAVDDIADAAMRLYQTATKLSVSSLMKDTSESISNSKCNSPTPVADPQQHRSSQQDLVGEGATSGSTVDDVVRAKLVADMQGALAEIARLMSMSLPRDNATDKVDSETEGETGSRSNSRAGVPMLSRESSSVIKEWEVQGDA